MILFSLMCSAWIKNEDNLRNSSSAFLFHFLYQYMNHIVIVILVFTVYNIVTEVQIRWLRLRQRFCKERQLREEEAKSGAAKPTRQKCHYTNILPFCNRV